MKDLVAKDAIEQVRRWDAGETIWTVEMGGMGPGYEQCIQVLAIEITRDYLGSPIPAPEDTRTFGDQTMNRVDEWLGCSGAQFGAAKWLAYQWLTIGPAALHAKSDYKSRRHIQASRTWPHVPVPADGADAAQSGTPEVKQQ